MVVPGLPPPAQFATQYLNPTGAPVLIQLGSLDDYDNAAGHCRTLAQTVGGAARCSGIPFASLGLAAFSATAR
jgi:hypothetical protein